MKFDLLTWEHIDYQARDQTYSCVLYQVYFQVRNKVYRQVTSQARIITHVENQIHPWVEEND